MTKNIFFDFDGTLIDCSQRLYRLFSELVPKSTLSYDEYWKIKRGRVNQKKLLMGRFDYSEEELEAFQKLWLSKVEESNRLESDKPFSMSSQLLKQLSKHYNLYVVTNRQSKSKVLNQINSFGWQEFLTEILVTEQKTTKEELIRGSCSFSKDDYFIGDTGEDIRTGQALGIKTIAVTSGFLSGTILQEYEPDLILEGIEKIDENSFIS